MDVSRILVDAVKIIALIVRTLGSCWKINAIITGAVGFYLVSKTNIEGSTILLIGAGWVLLGKTTADNIVKYMRQGVDEIEKEVKKKV
tara:strand:+ start:110 stop:373 length:264 start_codon:yes stop_codon:yes gene_type:complete